LVEAESLNVDFKDTARELGQNNLADHDEDPHTDENEVVTDS